MARGNLRERLARGAILFDGAMGTELYRRGQFVNKPFEGVNLSDPALVEQIHREYVDAGAEIVETNTFAASRPKLRRVGLEDQFDALNREGMRLARSAAGDRAWVAAAIGPSGHTWSTLGDDARVEVVEAFVEQAKLLIDAGADAVVLETFSQLHELVAALQAIRPLTDLPILALCAFTGDGSTADGAGPDVVAQQLIPLGADLIGANCADGPSELYGIAEQLVKHGHPVCIMPNAGYPKRVDGRMIYMATPEYFAVYARRLLKIGVRAVGGCCGTMPEHIKAMSGAVKMMSGGAVEAPALAVRVLEDRVERLTAVPLADRSPLARKIASNDGFVVSVEVNPPASLDPASAIEGARLLKAAGIDVINIADGPRASVRMSNWSLGLLVREHVGIDCIIHVCMRDRNLLGLQGDLLGLHALGLHNTVIITGDPPKMGDYPDATAVFDLDSIGAIGMVRDFNEGLNPAGRSIGGQTKFLIACGVEPSALDYDRELRRLEQKVAAGADFIMTQPVYDPAVLQRFLDDIAYLGKPVLVGLLPLASARNAEFLHNEVPGMQIPASIRERMAKVGSGAAARREGVRIAQEALLAVRDRVRGAYIMPPFARYEAAVEILECVGYEIPAEFRESWRS